MKHPHRNVTAAVVAAALLACTHAAHAQDSPSQPASAKSGQPTVIHIHHHHYYNNPGSSAAEMESFYSPAYAWNFGYQPSSGTMVQPWKQNWGHLGFTGYLALHSTGWAAKLDPRSGVTGLVVDKVTPDSPASKIGLVPGDFILKINGTAVDNYKQVAVLFEQTLEPGKSEVDLSVWNPHTRRTSELTAVIDKD